MSFINKYIKHIIAGLNFILLFFLSWLIWLKYSQVFPDLQDGIYLGQGNLSDKFNFLILKERSNLSFFIINNKKGKSVIRGDIIWRKGKPLEVRYGNRYLVLKGGEASQGIYSGYLRDLMNDLEGEWQLVKAGHQLQGINISALIDKNIEYLIDILSESNSVNLKIDKLKEKIVLLSSDIKDLHTMISNPDALVENAKEEVKNKRILLAKLNHENASLIRKINKLEKKLKVAISISPYGKLYKLIRTIDSQERKWLDNFNKNNPVLGLPQKVADQYLKGIKVESLLNQIAEKEQKLKALREANEDIS